MALDGPTFYNNAEAFASYMRRRAREESPNDTLENPDLLDLIGEVAGLRVLDLGCGNAEIGRDLLAAGAFSYLGLDPSECMLAEARKTLAGTPGEVVAGTIEDWTYPTNAFDLVISRLALHYIDDVEPMYRQVFQALTPGGRFVFSVEHPVITSCNRSLGADGRRQDWIVDQYHVPGLRVIRWLDQDVVRYHRTVEEYFGGLQGAGFAVEGLREARPRREHFLNEETYLRRLRIPLMLLMAARKPS